MIVMKILCVLRHKCQSLSRFSSFRNFRSAIHCEASIFEIKKTICLFVFFCAFVIAAPFAFSIEQLSVQKALKTSDISVGDNVEIILKFENPFGKAIPLKIQDKNILGGNGVDIQCMEYIIPEQKTVDVSYPAIQAFDSGDFTLEQALITYTNPETGKEENVTSGEIEVLIKKSASAQNVQQQGITTVYQCNGVSMQSTSYSSSSSSQNQQNQNQNNQNQQQNQQAQNQMQDKVNSMQQQNQNMEQIKQELQKQAQEEEAVKQEMMKNIESNPDFQKQDQELQKQGYRQSEKIASPEQNQSGESNPNEGSFNYQYKKESGETASIKGNMQNGTIQNMQKWSSEDEKNAAKGIKNSSQFQKLEEELKKQGFELQNKSITPDAKSAGQNQNHGANAQQSANQGTNAQQSNNQNAQTQNQSANQTENATQKTAASFQYNYANPATNATASINGNATIIGNTINVTKINIEKNGENKNNFWYWLIALLIAAAVAYLYYKKTRMAPVVPVIAKAHKKRPLDYRKKARQMIEEAEKLFANSLQKEAYVTVSRAVRFYFKHRFDKTEMTSSDILRAISSEDADYIKNVRECFSTCDLVNFAKYEPNARDFRKVTELAKEIVKIS
ncbi:MAG: hypothetical protein ABIF85_05980 [Nanoarchaeota archaeon]|nr:hypothetical protein [Nanoarchaeota archaeon]MCG2723196.1 hypothetical protein [archaeon]